MGVYSPYQNSSVRYWDDFLFKLSMGHIRNQYPVKKFGRNDSVAGTIVPICMGGFYRMPTAATAGSCTVDFGLVVVDNTELSPDNINFIS